MVENSEFDVNDQATRQNIVFIVRDLVERMRRVEMHIDELRREMLEATFILKNGQTGGAEKVFDNLQEQLRKMKEEITVLEMKTNKWEGMGAVFYVIITIAGAGVGWLLSHIGFSK